MMVQARLLFIAALSMPYSIANFNTSRVNMNALQRIFGGSEVPENEHVPYLVSLQYQTRRGIIHNCGGSIIAPNRILTAAHCCKDMNVTLMTVLAGVRNLDDHTGFRSKVVTCSIHPDYKSLVTSDLAVLSIDPPLHYNNLTIAPISVNGKEFVPGNVSVTITGWGLRFPISISFLEFFMYPKILQRVNYSTITNKQCRDWGMDKVTDTEICVRGLLKGACAGDSGGPLVMTTSKGLLQVGIAAYAPRICGLFLIPDVYTRLYTFRDWIQKQINQ